MQKDYDKIILTKNGLKKLQEELEHLKNVERQEVAQMLKEARAHGDLSENAEFEFAKERQAQLESRIKELEKMISEAEIYSDEEVDDNVVAPGRKVVLKNLDNGHILEVEVVGFGETDSSTLKVSISSPVGKALFKKKVGETVEVEAPAGKFRFEIVKVNKN
ncbi:MAG: transcription elongation factor GreA [Actinobacteria bacterium]|nr:transcription elongation factor GreA [Actinomycetota bacterium]